MNSDSTVVHRIDSLLASAFSTTTESSSPSPVHPAVETTRRLDAFGKVSHEVLSQLDPSTLRTIFTTASSASLVTNTTAGTVVRGVGMVQDMQMEPSLLSGSRSSFFSSLLLSEGAEEENTSEITHDCYLLYVVPLCGSGRCGSSDDASAAATSPATTTVRRTERTDKSSNRKKRTRGGDEDDNEEPSSPNDDPDASPTAAAASATAETQRVPPRPATEQQQQQQTTTTGQQQQQQPIEGTLAAVGYAGPFSDDPHGIVATPTAGISILVPHASGLSTPRLNDVVEFVCVVLPDADSAASDDNEGNALNPFSIGAADPPGWQSWCQFEALPRGLVLQAVAAGFSLLRDVDVNRVSHDLLLKGGAHTTSTATLKSKRQQSITCLSRWLDGDDLLAELLLMHLIAAVTRHTEACAIGDLPVHVHAPTLAQAQRLAVLLGLLRPSSICTIDSSVIVRPPPPPEPFVTSLHDMVLFPKYDFDKNRMAPSPIQLPAGAHMSILLPMMGSEETTTNRNGMFIMECGDPKVVERNRECFQQLFLNQRIEYDFEYSTTRVDVDVQIAILTVGSGNKNSIVFEEEDEEEAMLVIEGLDDTGGEAAGTRRPGEGVGGVSSSVEKFKMPEGVVSCLPTLSVKMLSSRAQQTLRDSTSPSPAAARQEELMAEDDAAAQHGDSESSTAMAAARRFHPKATTEELAAVRDYISLARTFYLDSSTAPSNHGARVLLISEEELRMNATTDSDERFFEEDLVSERRAHPELFNDTSVIHNTTVNTRMALARCIAASEGSLALQRTHWQRMKELEAARYKRNHLFA